MRISALPIDQRLKRPTAGERWRDLLPWRYGVVFILALAARIAVSVLVSNHPATMLQPDSKIYMDMAQNLLAHGAFTVPDGPTPVYLVRTPLYPSFLAFLLWLLGGRIFSVVIVQTLIDSLSCALTYHLSERVWKGTGWVSGILACLSLNMITYAHFILSDSLFLFTFLVGVTGILAFIEKPGWARAAFVGFCLGVAALVRPVILYFPLFLVPLLSVYLLLGLGHTPFRALGMVALLVFVFSLCLLPWASRNYAQYGRFSLTAQGGEHLLQYIVPSVWQYSKRIPILEAMERSVEEFQSRLTRDGFHQRDLNPFLESDLQTQVALDILRQEPKTALVKAWVLGMAKNLFAPALVDFSYLLKIDRPHFSETKGDTPLAQVKNFIFGMKGFFGRALAGNIILILICRALQAWGLVLLLKTRPWEAITASAVILYYLLISGPIGYAKYRLPFEPVLIIFLAVAIRDLFERWKETVGGVRFEVRA